MTRCAFAGLVMLALSGAVAAEEDHGSTLVDLFAGTCAKRPASPLVIQLFASELGFVSSDRPITADMERGPQIDILYMARFTKQGLNVGLSAYFSGPADAPSVSCSLSSADVSAEALLALIENSLKVRDRTEETANDGNRRLAKWRVGAAENGDTLDMSAWRVPPRRASIGLTYRGGRR